jgi:hypothetical protein
MFQGSNRLMARFSEISGVRSTQDSPIVQFLVLHCSIHLTKLTLTRLLIMFSDVKTLMAHSEVFLMQNPMLPMYFVALEL